MKKLFWILVIIAGAVLMIVGSATGSAGLYAYLLTLMIPYIGPEFVPLVTAIMVVLEYIAFFGGWSVLVGVFLILIKFNRLGRLVITIATSFGLLGLIIYAVAWIVGYFNIALSPMWQTVLDTIYSIFTFNSGMAFAGTAIAVKKEAEEALEEVAEKESSSIDPNTKYCPECGAQLPVHANFCNKCGKNFD